MVVFCVLDLAVSSIVATGEGNGNPLQCSCLENPRDGSLVGCRLQGRTELDMTEATEQQQHIYLLPPEPASHPPHPTFLGGHVAPD